MLGSISMMRIGTGCFDYDVIGEERELLLGERSGESILGFGLRICNVGLLTRVDDFSVDPQAGAYP